MDEEVAAAEEANCAVLIEMDFNAKLGSEIIMKDSSHISENGKLLRDIIVRRNLIVGNASEKCDGTITRRKNTIHGIEESVLDYVLFCERQLKGIAW